HPPSVAGHQPTVVRLVAPVSGAVPQLRAARPGILLRGGRRRDDRRVAGRDVDTWAYGDAESVLRSHRWRTVENSAGYLLPHLTPGTSLLDVGCGPGTLTVDLAARVAPGRVVGVDVTPQIVEQARAHAAQMGADEVTFFAGDVRTLSLPPASFDIVHAHQVLQHLSDPVAAL